MEFMKKLFWTENLRFRNFCPSSWKVLPPPLEIFLATPLYQDLISFTYGVDIPIKDGLWCHVGVLAHDSIRVWKVPVAPFPREAGQAKIYQLNLVITDHDIERFKVQDLQPLVIDSFEALAYLKKKDKKNF